MNKGMFVAALLAVFLFISSGLAYGGDYVVTRWRPSGKGCGRRMAGASVTIKYRGSGTRLLSTSCITAVFEDETSCQATGSELDNVRISPGGKGVTRHVCFCGSRARLRDILYTCKEPF
ncbi:MAG: hypothetical protein M0Z79_03535 [Nitrospiraceae bacterium]|nr:hypothetical protein [Nitrospiraceae bacterium]